MQPKVYKLGEEAPQFERGTPEEHLRLLEQLRTMPLLGALRPELQVKPMVRTKREVTRVNQSETINTDFNDFLHALNDHQVRYLIVGAMAVAVHGHVRYTRDLHIWVERSPENAARVVAAFHAFGLDGPSLNFLLKEDVFFRVGEGSTVIDVFTGMGPGFKFQEHLERAVLVNLNGLSVPVLGLQDLIRIKTRAGRPQDVADVAVLKAIQAEQERG